MMTIVSVFGLGNNVGTKRRSIINIDFCIEIFFFSIFFVVSEGEHEKLSKKELLLGRRKDKKDKKDRGYATLDGESSPEEDHDTK